MFENIGVMSKLHKFSEIFRFFEFVEFFEFFETYSKNRGFFECFSKKSNFILQIPYCLHVTSELDSKSPPTLRNF
jgi:hypothetical protein